MRIPWRPHRPRQRNPASGFDPVGRVAARESQHRQRRVDPLLVDGYGSEDAIDDDQRRRPDPLGPIAVFRARRIPLLGICPQQEGQHHSCDTH